ncbi:MAG TPA: non-canonical purine NTP pyrophosphatase [Longimicrobiales bacterium]|nr:non-canonical purine NTP pyrophosphatase [Longimicrobiales bacterium]
MAQTGTLLLATRSTDKAREIRDILRHACNARIVTLDDAGIADSGDEEHLEAFDTCLANAHAKAAFFLQRSGMPTIADDSGIHVDALHGAPGVHSKRFAPAHALTGRELDDANNHHLVTRLHGVPAQRRTAHYTCAAVLHRVDGRRCASLGVRDGLILDLPRGAHGFGYDPLFLDAATGQTFGEMDPALKNLTSHRARAFRALAPYL